MAELADAYDSGSYEATRAGSSPVWCTTYLLEEHMKRILTIFIVLMLCACSGGISWNDVKDKYSDFEQNYTDYPESITKDDYLHLFDQLESNIELLKAGVKKDDTQIADTIYQTAVKLESFASIVNSINAVTIQDLANKTKQLVEAAYNKDKNFDDLKTTLLEEYKTVRDSDENFWSSLVKKANISWNSVEETYNSLAEETIANMQSRRTVTELELEELNNIIGAYYKNIQDGVNEDNQDKAKEIYLAGLQLSEYTEDVEGEIPEKVHDYGLQAMQYVIDCYGGPVTLENYDFVNIVEAAQKWPLSLWNELTAILKK